MSTAPTVEVEAEPIDDKHFEEARIDIQRALEDEAKRLLLKLRTQQDRFLLNQRTQHDEGILVDRVVITIAIEATFPFYSTKTVVTVHQMPDAELVVGRVLSRVINETIRRHRWDMENAPEVQPPPEE
jgi:hypothetical protein